MVGPRMTTISRNQECGCMCVGVCVCIYIYIYIHKHIISYLLYGGFLANVYIVDWEIWSFAANARGPDSLSTVQGHGKGLVVSRPLLCLKTNCS